MRHVEHLIRDLAPDPYRLVGHLAAELQPGRGQPGINRLGLGGRSGIRELRPTPDDDQPAKTTTKLAEASRARRCASQAVRAAVESLVSTKSGERPPEPSPIPTSLGTQLVTAPHGGLKRRSLAPAWVGGLLCVHAPFRRSSAENALDAALVREAEQRDSAIEPCRPRASLYDSVMTGNHALCHRVVEHRCRPPRLGAMPASRSGAVYSDNVYCGLLSVWPPTGSPGRLRLAIVIARRGPRAGHHRQSRPARPGSPSRRTPRRVALRSRSAARLCACSGRRRMR